MPGEFGTAYRKLAGSILASTFVLLVGGLGILLGLLIAGGDLTYVIWTVGLTAVGLTAFFWLIRACSSINARGQYLWVFGLKSPSQEEYQPKRASRSRQVYGQNQPPSADEVRDMKEGLHNWVPARTYHKRKLK